MPSPKHPSLDVTSVLQPAERQVQADLGTEIAMLHLDSGVFYGLDKIGTRIFSMLDGKATVSNIVDQLVDHFEVAHEECARDVLELLEQMRAAGLVVVVGDEAAP